MTKQNFKKISAVTSYANADDVCHFPPIHAVSAKRFEKIVKIKYYRMTSQLDTS